MSMLPMAAKLGGSGVLAAGIPAAIYFSSEGLSFYEVEKEVMEKQVKLSITKEASSATVTVSASTSGETPSLTTGYSWSCVIEIEPKVTEGGGNNSVDSLESKLKENLPVDQNTKHLNNKILLVKACAKNRGENPSNSSVKGKLKVKESGSGTKTFLFEYNQELDVLLGSN